MFPPFHLTWPTPAEATLVVVLYILLAVTVSIDVLLKKSDVRSALGWIGTVWLAPILGAAIAGATFHLITGVDRRDRDISGEIDPEDRPATA